MKKLTASSKTAQKGSVLFYILIAVALLAALSYAVASSSRSNNGGIDGERASLAASEILEYANTVGNAVTQLRLRGCTDTQISFENAVSSFDFTNTGSPLDNSCDVFNVAGGGIQYAGLKPEWLDTNYSSDPLYNNMVYTGATCIDFIGTGERNCNNNDATRADLIMVYPFIKKEICQNLNLRLGVMPKGAEPPADGADAWNSTHRNFQGVYNANIRLVDDGSNRKLSGKRAACFAGTTTPSGGYHFYKVLLAR